MDCSPPGSSVHGILQARILEWVAMPSSSNPGIEPTSLMSPELAGGFFTTSTTWEAHVHTYICITHIEKVNGSHMLLLLLSHFIVLDTRIIQSP